MEKKELNLDNFGEIMDVFLTENECMMLFTMPEGTQDIAISDNMHGGPVLQFYFLIKALIPISKDMLGKLGGAGNFDWKRFVDGTLKMVREELMEVEQDEV